MATVTFRRRPVLVEAVQWAGDNYEELRRFTGDRIRPFGNETVEVFDELHGSWGQIRVGDWVLRGVVGEFYPIRAEVLVADVRAGRPVSGGVWSLVVVAPCRFITANRDRDRYGRAELVRQWRSAAFFAARQAGLPVGLGRVRIEVVARFRGRPPVRDLDNLRPTLKACVDGLGPARLVVRVGYRRGYSAPGWGLIPDDDVKHLDGPHLSLGEPLPAKPYAPVGELHLTITDLTDDEGNLTS